MEWIIQNNSFMINLLGKEGCLLRSCFKNRVERNCFYDTPFHTIFAGKHSKRQDADELKGNLDQHGYDL